MPIPFTQYLMPDGRKTQITLDLDEETEAKAQKILAKGFKFECEMLSDYATVSFTVTHPTLDEGEPLDVAAEIARNGPDVPVKVKKLIMDFDPDANYSEPLEVEDPR